MIILLKPIDSSFIHGISWVRIKSNPQTHISNFTSFARNPAILGFYHFGHIWVEDPALSLKPFAILENRPSLTQFFVLETNPMFYIFNI